MNRLSPLSAAVLRGCGSLLAPGGRNGSLLVLIYHRVLAQPDPLLPDEPDVTAFAAQMDVIRATCQVLPLAEAVERLYSGSLPPRAACITFDDGYANNLTCAAPVLAQRRMPATVFIATGFIGGGRMWNDTVIEAVRRAGAELDLAALGLGRYSLPDVESRRRAFQAIINALKYREPAERLGKATQIAERVGSDLPTDLMLAESQLKQLRGAGLEVGAHTVTHPILARLDSAAAKREIAASKSYLEAVVGEPVRLFAYPNGRPTQDYERQHVDMVRAAGFAAAVSTAWGSGNRGSDRFQLPRLLPWDRSPVRFAARLLRAYGQTRSDLAQ